ncbi:MAG: Cytochrome oxidase assembly [Ramalina farinacea]|uniref:Cytochrome c oxidase assembly protein COX16, mitochondrial n=1 Tax=Ramalina farinacea TaxID=258253 RepID=A0AA43QKD4_9LECA|nr:Cytochrome oxidase assembly [Ramalina farinacea]
MSPISSTFTSKKYRPSSASPASSPANAIGAWYRRSLTHHPFALFGLPFIVTMVAGSFFLTPATALRYEKHDRKVKQLTQEEAMGLGKDRRKVDISEEYYRLASKDLDSWEQKRVGRLEGETDGKV